MGHPASVGGRVGRRGRRSSVGRQPKEPTVVSAPGPEDVAPIDDWSQLLRDRVAVVTGGGDGIGGAISTLFAQHGALVEIAGGDEDGAAPTGRAIDDAGGTAPPHIVDVTVPADIDRLATDVLAMHG